MPYDKDPRVDAYLDRLADGLRVDDAQRFAGGLVASSEGAVVLARAEQSLEPFDLVADQLLEQVRALAERAR